MSDIFKLNQYLNDNRTPWQRMRDLELKLLGIKR